MAKKIVVVDDEPEILELLELNLKKEGYEVIPCESGREAVEAIKKSVPDLVILDVMLPGMDGHDIAQHLAQEESTKEIPILVLTALEQSKAMFDKVSQVRAFLPKPFALSFFLQTVKEILG